MEKEDTLKICMKESANLGLYDILNRFSEKYAKKLPGSVKHLEKKILSNNYAILLKKETRNFIDIPTDFSDEDILNALYLLLCEFNDYEKIKHILKKFAVLYEFQHTDLYQKSVGPVLKMIYSITINESSAAKIKKYRKLQKQERVWFDARVITAYLNNTKKYLPHKEMKFFEFPKVPYSLSEGDLAPYRSSRLPASLRFDYIFKKGKANRKREKLSFEMDEGFVTPSDEHKEKSPWLEQKAIISNPENKKFYWDYDVVKIPPSKFRTWEKFDLVGRNSEHHFIPKKMNIQYWLSKAPQCFTKISKKRLLDDITSLLIGIPSTTFIYNRDFHLKAGIYTDDLSSEDVIEMTKPYLEAAEAFLALTKIAENTSWSDTITRAFKLALKQYLYNYQLMIFQIISGKNTNKAYVCDIELLIEQVIYLKKLLVQCEELKGIALLEYLYRNMESSSVQKFHLLALLFLSPCIHYFRLIDDWIFLSRWHKDLPIAPCDISLVEDRQSWEEAYKPIQLDVPWFIPVQDLAYCGKALLLLSLSKKSEKFLNMLKTGDHPKVKLCLQLHELKKLETECRIYYEKAKSTFHSDKDVKLNLVLCAQNSAKMRALAFEESKNKKKGSEMERKRKELLMREEDLIRSAKIKEDRKHEEELDNKRVADEMEEIVLKEKIHEFKKAKAVYKIIKEEQDKEEKNELRADWKLRRHQNIKKRREFFNDGMYENTHLDDEYRGQHKSLENKEIDVSLSHVVDKQKKLENKDLINDINLCNKDNEYNNTKYSELVKNRTKVLGSDLGVGEYMAEYLSEKGMDAETGNLPLKVKETAEMIESSDANKYSELVKNRLKSLHSDFGRGDIMTFTVGQIEAERNKNQMLGTHFILGTDVNDDKKIQEINVENNKELPENNKETSSEILEVNDICDSAVINEGKTPSKKVTDDFLVNMSQLSISETKCCSNLEESDMSGNDKIDDEPEPAREYLGVNGVSWFRNCYRQIETVKNLFKTNDQLHSEQSIGHYSLKDLFKPDGHLLLPQQSLDHYSLWERVPGSLKVVLETQVKLVNEALLEMFLGELKLLDEAGKLKKYFFLDGEFGKKLTSSLCVAIEKEKPSTLLTFGKLRDLLTIASHGDDRISFIVKDTPVAFEHTNPQALSCLGMSYKFNWPLNLIFTDIALSKYNEIFEYILSLERVTWHLDQVWLALKFKSSQMKGNEYTQIQLYRHVMSQFVSTLRWYITTTVFENCWQKFNRGVQEVTNLQELYRKHASYIKEVIFKCFLNDRLVGLMKKIQSLLKYILIFCQVMRFGEWSISEVGNYHHCNFIKLQNTFSCFLKLARCIIGQFEKLVKINYQDGLPDLYSLLTLNSFYCA